MNSSLAGDAITAYTYVMLGLGVRLLWLVITSMALSFGSYIVVVQSIFTKESGATQPVQFLDELRPGVHYISGMITVPNACDELTVRVIRTDDYTYNLKFVTWEEPSIRCARDAVPRHFSTIAFAPSAGVRFTAELDGIPFPVIMKQRVMTEKAALEVDALHVNQ